MWTISRGSLCAAAGVTVIVGVLMIVQQRNTRAWRSRFERAVAERDDWSRKHRALQERFDMMSAQQQAERELIGQLWRLVQGDRSRRTPSVATPSEPRYGLDTVKEMLRSSGGDLGAAVHQIMTPERLEATVERHVEEAGCWAAVASLCADPDRALAYLEEAAVRHPESFVVQAALVEARMARGTPDASILTSINTLRALDPDNALPDQYEAYYRLQAGDVPGALEALAVAGDKNRFADHRLELLMQRYECLAENGCSDSAAIGLSAFTLSFDHLPMMREIGQRAVEQARVAFVSGQSAQGLQIVDTLLRLGSNMSASGRFLVYDRVGIDLQQAALEAKRDYYQAAGNSFQVQEIGFQQSALQERAARIAEMSDAFGAVLAGMQENDMVRYIESTIMHGEFSTLREITSGQEFNP